MEKQSVQQIRVILDLIERRKFLITLFSFLGITIGLLVYLSQPKMYMGTALLSYQQQEINTEKMKPGFRDDIKDIVSTVSQIVLSLTSLEKIIIDEKLYLEKREVLPMEDVVEQMRKHILIRPSKEGDTFVISYTGSNPVKVERVTNTLSARFIEENLKYREEKAAEASVYTQDELQMAKEIIDRKEAVMRDFKIKHYYEMPDQQVNNNARLIALQEQYQQRQDSIQDLEKTRVLVREQMAAHKQFAANEAVNAEEIPTREISLKKELLKAKNVLQLLQVKYTDQHPKIIRLKKHIESLETSLREKGILDVNGNPVETGIEEFDKTLFDLELQLKGIELSIEKLQKEKDELQKNIDQNNKWIEAAPVREAEWTSLTREYDQLKRRYDFLVGQNLQARSALNLERKQQGSQFKVEDPARRPTKPVKPDFIKILGVALAAGIAAGGGLAFGLNLMDPSFHDPDALEQYAKIPVLCSVPSLSLDHELSRQKKVFAAQVFFFCIWAGGIVAAMYYFWRNGKIILGIF